MNMSMDYKKANLAYFFMILSTFMLVLIVSFFSQYTGVELSLPVNNVLCEMAILVPAVAITMYSGEALSAVIPLKKIKISTFILSIIYVASLFPLVDFVNSLSMLFVDNMVDSISGELVELPMWIMLLSVGLFGPFVEEIVFRGVIFHSYRRSTRIVASMVLSSILFGMMHMNFNQFAYGAVMGFMLCLMVEATGSVIPSFIAHAVFNSYEVIVMYQVDSKEVVEEAVSAENYREQLLGAIGIYFLFSVVFTAIALCVVYKMAELEGNKHFFDKLGFKNNKKNAMDAETGFFMEEVPKEKKPRLVTVPLVIAMSFAFAYMLLTAAYL
ncbi:MAG: CPBP family intramembrane metalloprotease [Butyrivibrio sp.]|nr:CPBP family intramembrane metalloprotease [Butyrivibrio sp.]